MKGLYIAMFALLGLAALMEAPLKVAYLKMNPVKPVVRYQDVLLDLLGEGRTMLARYLWFKMDTMHEQMDDQRIETFRQKEVVPLLRMINYLDPYLTDAYDTLSYELYYGYRQLDKAVDLIDEGLKYSPDVYDLNFRRAFLAERQKDPVAAFQYARKALAADQDEMHNLAALRTMYRACVSTHDAQTGLQVVDAILQRTGGANPYQEQSQRWKEELRRK